MSLVTVVIGSQLIGSEVIFPSSCVHAYDSMADAMHGPIPAVTRHSETGIGWDRSFKQRQGWSVGGTLASLKEW